MDINKACLKVTGFPSASFLKKENEMSNKWQAIWQHPGAGRIFFALLVPLIQLLFFTVFTALNIKRNDQICKPIKIKLFP